MAVQERGTMLVVDDDAVIARMFQQYFIGHGFTVDAVNSVAEAMLKIQAVPYRLILSDLRLGQGSRGGDGLELLVAIRARLPNAGIIVLTAFADLRTIQEALARGAHRVLQKPIPLRDLLAVVGEVLAAPAVVPAIVTARS